MKISTNSIGNYGPAAGRSISSEQPKVKNSIPEEKQFQIDDNTPLTNDEKGFFLKLYPNNTNEIKDYHFYEKSGKMSGVKLGSIINRRG